MMKKRMMLDRCGGNKAVRPIEKSVGGDNGAVAFTLHRE
jgi:hypothetical protein